MKLENVIFVIISILLLPLLVQAGPRRIHLEWEYQYSVDVAGYRLYLNNNLVCESPDPSSSTMDCTVDASDGESWFTLTSFFQDATESPHSAPFSYIFSSSLKALAVVDTHSGDCPLPIAFDATTSTGSIVSYEWIFGDGEVGSGETVNHTFTTAGNFNVTLKVTDNGGAVDQQTVAVVVNPPASNNVAPVAVISSSTSVGQVPLLLEFDATGSTDSDGTILLYEWDMGDGGTDNGSKVSYTYSSPGTYYAALTITDDGGLTSTISTPIIVDSASTENIAPIAVISASSNSGPIPLAVTFNAAKSNDPDGNIIAYTWNFGDGTSGSGINIKHKYTQTAVYSVTLKVTDNLGRKSQQAVYLVKAFAPGTQPAIISVLPSLFYLLQTK